jgi:hypothetical protein
MQLLLLCFVGIILANCADIVVFGLNNHFHIIPGTAVECHNSKTCYRALCQILSTNCTTYASFALTESNPNCSFHGEQLVSMVMFITTRTRMVFNESARTCHNFAECLSTGCAFCKAHKGAGWIIFTGQCLNSY